MTLAPASRAYPANRTSAPERSPPCSSLPRPQPLPTCKSHGQSISCFLRSLRTGFNPPTSDPPLCFMPASSSCGKAPRCSASSRSDGRLTLRGRVDLQLSEAGTRSAVLQRLLEGHHVLRPASSRTQCRGTRAWLPRGQRRKRRGCRISLGGQRSASELQALERGRTGLLGYQCRQRWDASMDLGFPSKHILRSRRRGLPPATKA